MDQAEQPTPSWNQADTAVAGLPEFAPVSAAVETPSEVLDPTADDTERFEYEARHTLDQGLEPVPDPLAPPESEVPGGGLSVAGSLASVLGFVIERPVTALAVAVAAGAVLGRLLSSRDRP